MPIEFHREVTPEKPTSEQPRQVYTIIECDSGEIMLSPDEVALLREMLATWQEDKLFPGTKYTTPIKLENGKLVLKWQPKHDG